MTAVGELLRALFEAAAADGDPWTDGYKPDIIYVFDEAQFKSGSFTNNAKLFIFPAIPPNGGKEDIYEDGWHKHLSTHYFILQRNDEDDDKLDTQLGDIYDILQASAVTGYDDNYITELVEHVDRRNAGVTGVAITGKIAVEDWTR